MADKPGRSVDNPVQANLKNPAGFVTIVTDKGRMRVDMNEVAKVAERLGTNAFDTLSIPGYRNAKGELVPDYDGIRIEKRAE